MCRFCSLSFDEEVEGRRQRASRAQPREGSTRLGYPETVILGIGIVELACLLAYAVPRTSILGAILLTGYLGGAVATHVRIGSPLLTHTLFPIYVAVLVWGGVFLRDERLPALIPLRRRDA